MTYRLNRVHLLITAFAGVVLSGGFVYHRFFAMPHTLFSMALWVSSGLVLFYCIGFFARAYLIQNVFVPPPEYDFSQDEEYLAFMASLENDGAQPPPEEMQLPDPMLDDLMMEYDDSNDPFAEPISAEML
jgi:hypothetical protein